MSAIFANGLSTLASRMVLKTGTPFWGHAHRSACERLLAAQMGTAAMKGAMAKLTAALRKVADAPRPDPNRLPRL